MSIPHFSFPFRVTDNGSAAVVEQDTYAEIEQGVKVLVLTELGERLEVPEFGIPDPTFQVGYDLDTIAVSAATWDGRAQVLSAQEIDGMVETIRIHVEEQ